MSKRSLATFLTVGVLGAGLAAAPAATAFASHATKPTSVSLSSSNAKVTTSTKHAIHVEIGASNNPSTPANDQLTVTLSRGSASSGETHTWSFPITSSVLDVASSGKGTLEVPSSKLSPFGVVNLKITPVAKTKTQSCKGHLASKSVEVKLSGTFYFDSRSTGAHKWGSVGSKTKTFHFPATNRLTWLYGSAALENCLSTTTPCGASLFWTAQDGDSLFDGTESSNGSSVFASRTADLSKPKGASRVDTSTAPTKTPVLTVANDGSATLDVQADGGSGSGSAVITSPQQGASVPTPCGKGKTQNSQFWTGSYAPGTPALVVSEQIFGAITLGANEFASFGRTTS